jgi:hypothetical protein
MFNARLTSDAQTAIVPHLPSQGRRVRARITETNGADPNWRDAQSPVLTHRDDHQAHRLIPSAPPIPTGAMPTRDTSNGHRNTKRRARCHPRRTSMAPVTPNAGREERDNRTGATSIPLIPTGTTATCDAPQWSLRHPLATPGATPNAQMATASPRRLTRTAEYTYPQCTLDTKDTKYKCVPQPVYYVYHHPRAPNAPCHP